MIKVFILIFTLFLLGCNNCEQTKAICKARDKCKIVVNKNPLCGPEYDTYCPCRTVENGDFEFSDKGCIIVSSSTAIREINYLLDNGYCIEKGD